MIELLKKIRELLNTYNLFTTQGEKVYQTALSFIGKDASPNDEAPDEFGCAESVSTILLKSGCIIPIFLSTSELNVFLLKSPNWALIASPRRGDVIMSPTGMGGKNGVNHGHTGIMLSPTLIASNNSATGSFEQNYTLDSWTRRYKIKGNYPILFYRRLI